MFYPATPYDAKGLLASALAGDDPVVLFESRRLYDVVERFEPNGVPADDYLIPPGVPVVRRAGTDLTVLTIGPSLYPALEAAGTLQTDHGLSAEVVDARCLVPFDYAPLLDSVRRTGRLLVVSEACERGSVATTLAATVARHAHDALAAAPRVLGAPNWIVPGAEMESTYFPGADDILDVVLGDRFPDRAGDRSEPRGERRIHIEDRPARERDVRGGSGTSSSATGRDSSSGASATRSAGPPPSRSRASAASGRPCPAAVTCRTSSAASRSAARLGALTARAASRPGPELTTRSDGR